MKPFELLYKTGQNAQGDIIQKRDGSDLTEDEKEYLKEFAFHLFVTGHEKVLSQEGLNILISGFCSGIGYAGAVFGKVEKE